MKYCDSVEDSAKYLRIALQFMTQQAAALHPVSYAVWYEYAAGRNAALKAAVDEKIQDGALLDETCTNEIFRKFIAEIDEAAAERITRGFQKVMADMLHSASQAGDQAHQFGGVLEKWSETMVDLPLDGDMGLKALLQHTAVMQGSITTLRGRLDESRSEIEQLRREVVKAREDALADSLTGLANRKGFDLALAACLPPSEADQRGLCLLMLDIDFFKRVNDSYGHLFGDKVLRAVGQILKNNVKGKDTPVRYGGEEFAVLLPDTPLEGARQLAERIRTMVEGSRVKRLDNNETVANITISVGVACYRPDESASEFVARADSALYASKNQGRNRVTVAAE